MKSNESNKRDKKVGLLRCQSYSRWSMTRISREGDKTHRQSGEDEKERGFDARGGFPLDWEKNLRYKKGRGRGFELEFS